MSPSRSRSYSRRTLVIAGCLVIVVGCGVMAWLLADVRPPAPDRCPLGLLPTASRCCPAGEREDHGLCIGNAVGCPQNMSMKNVAGSEQCAAVAQRINIAGGTITLAPADWETEGLFAPRTITVHAFTIDNIEYTWGRYSDCIAAHQCDPNILAFPAAPPEAGTPITNIAPQKAAALCGAAGGRLPSGDEWIFAAAGTEGRRFPWGSTGLVCRRAAFGLAHGPCAHGANSPELAGSRPDGATPEGTLDLAGNVAEWTVEPQGHLARGGSFLSTVAGQLKTWASEAANGPSSHIGFRCVYDRN
ncbi:MAG TPA: SUMF1/EgtB/PvdO family nonheme iron enzyme [Polyangiaceae bacterium]|nr:SUMF1/EgtB/PvdO family nonheme iron enzyme [Polyangiaceae bacterium]